MNSKVVFILQSAQMFRNSNIVEFFKAFDEAESIEELAGAVEEINEFNAPEEDDEFRAMNDGMLTAIRTLVTLKFNTANNNHELRELIA